jgi:glutamate-1-semialdehyde 2,1-aminomutase
MNTENSKQLFDRARKVIPGGVHSPVRAFKGVGGVPRFIESAQGAEMVDVDGNRYIDFCMSWGPLIFGHQDPEITEAIHSALHKGWTYGAAEPVSLELAELIAQELPWVEKVRFVSSGTEAVMSALRLARAATGRSKILKFEGCYHGHADSMLVRSGSGLSEMASPDSAGVSATVAAETVVAPLNDVDAFKRIFEMHGKEIAAVIVEAIPANYGLLLQKENFLKDVSEIAHAAGSLVIFDEVITGFRVAFGGMAELTGVQPDLVTYGKIIGGGFPVGAYGGKSEWMDQVAPTGPVYQAGTLSANSVAMAAGLATLKKLKRLNPYAQLAKQVGQIAVQVEQLGKEAGLSVHVQHEGSILWMVLGEVRAPDQVVRTIGDIPEMHRPLYTQVFHSLLEHGIYLAPSACEVSFLSTAHTLAHQERYLEALKNIFSSLNDYGVR